MSLMNPFGDSGSKSSQATTAVSDQAQQNSKANVIQGQGTGASGNGAQYYYAPFVLGGGANPQPGSAMEPTTQPPDNGNSIPLLAGVIVAVIAVGLILFIPRLVKGLR